MNKTIVDTLIARLAGHTSYDIVDTVSDDFGFTTVALAPLHVQDELFNHVSIEFSPTRIVCDFDYHSDGDFMGRERHKMGNNLDSVRLYIIDLELFNLRNPN